MFSVLDGVTSYLNAFEADYAWIISWSTESVSKLRAMTKIVVTFHTW